MFFPIIDEMLDSEIVKDENGNNVPLRRNIDLEEGLFLYDLIVSNETINHSLEIVPLEYPHYLFAVL